MAASLWLIVLRVGTVASTGPLYQLEGASRVSAKVSSAPPVALNWAPSYSDTNDGPRGCAGLVDLGRNWSHLAEKRSARRADADLSSQQSDSGS